VYDLKKKKPAPGKLGIFDALLKLGLDPGPHPTLTTARGECKDGLFPLVTKLTKFVSLKASENRRNALIFGTARAQLA